MPRVRDFNPENISATFNRRILVTHNSHPFQGKSWLFTIFLPRWLMTERGKVEICTPEDQDLLEDMLEYHFGGLSVEPEYLKGIGKREGEMETNLHRRIIFIASRWRGTMRYLNALRSELEACSGEEQILILRQELYII